MWRPPRQVLLLLGAVACAGGMAGPTIPSPVAAFRPGDRVVLGNFSRITALAASFDRVYVAYSTALAIWRPLDRRWEVPRSPPQAGVMRSVTAAVVDPADLSVWFLAGESWLRYDPTTNRWSGGLLPARAQAIAVDPANAQRGIWFRLATGWVVQPRLGGLALPAVPSRTLQYPSTIDDARRDLPQLGGLAGRILTGPRLSQGTFTAAVADPTGRGWFLGTSNRGLLFFDRTATDAVPMGLGLPGDVVGAIDVVADGIWVATDADVRTPAAVTFLPNDLADSRALPGSPVAGMPFDAVRAILPGEHSLWIASDKGVVRAGLDDGRVDRWDAAQGVPDQRVTSVAQFHDQIVIGTARGLATMKDDGTFTRRGENFLAPVYSLLVHGDTLWVGSALGLYASLAGNDEPLMPKGFRLLSTPGVAILGLGYVADTLVAMTPDRLLWRDPLSGVWSPGPPLAAQLGPLRAFAATPAGVWVGGTNGAGFVRPTIGILRILLVPGDLPDQVTAIASAGSYLWVGTTSGLVRFLLEER